MKSDNMVGLLAFLFLTFLSIHSTAFAGRNDGFHIDVESGSLLDANKILFEAKGINHLLGYYDNNNRNWYGNSNNIPEATSPTGYFATDSIPYIAAKGFNTIRLVATTSLPVARLKTAVSESISNKMVPVVTLHYGSTLSNNTGILEGCAIYWRDFWNGLTAGEKNLFERYLIINIVNEWGTWNMDFNGDGHDINDRVEWARQYMNAVDLIRSSGFEGVLMIDAPGGGQRPEAVQEQGSAILNHDAKKNLMFSLHIYEDFQKNYNLENVLNSLQASKIPVLIGEFGPRSTTDVIDVMTRTTEKGIGYIGWAWQGDGTSGDCNTILNVVRTVDDIPGLGEYEVKECWGDFRDWKGDYLTGWGNTLINHPTCGVSATSRKSSLFFDISDVILVLQPISGINPTKQSIKADMNNDSRVDLHDAIHILQLISESK